MNRTIKFRAWDTNKNKMIYPGDKAKWAKYKDVTSGDLVGWFEDEDLMQFTGLKDKNGKEVYFDDLVKFGIRLSRVVWNKVEGKIELLAIMQDGSSVENLNMKDSALMINEYEIIGNIYEKAQELKNDRGDDSGKYENKDLLK